MPTDILRSTHKWIRKEPIWRHPVAVEPFMPGPADSAKDDVLASEAATYAFCVKAWHLEHALRQPPSEGAVQLRSQGTALHEEHGARIGTSQRAGQRLVVWTVSLLVLAVVLVILALLASP